MPRLSRTVVAARETVAINLFQQGKTIDEVQLALAQGWNGQKMNLPRLKELQRNIGPSQPVDAVVESKPTAVETNDAASESVVDVSVTPVTTDNDAPVFSDAVGVAVVENAQPMTEFV